MISLICAPSSPRTDLMLRKRRSWSQVSMGNICSTVWHLPIWIRRWELQIWLWVRMWRCWTIWRHGRIRMTLWSDSMSWRWMPQRHIWNTWSGARHRIRHWQFISNSIGIRVPLQQSLIRKQMKHMVTAPDMKRGSGKGSRRSNRMPTWLRKRRLLCLVGWPLH